MSTRHLLQETANFMKKTSNVRTDTLAGARATLADGKLFKNYLRSLSEGLSDTDAETFQILAINSRRALMENSMYQLNPYETLTVPILRVFYPKLIAKELVNVMPIDKPEIIKGFLKAYFKKNGETGFTHQFPSVNVDISRGPGTTVTIPGYVTVPANATSIFAQIPGGGISASNSHIERDFYISKVQDSTGYTADYTILPDINGNFSSPVTIAASGVSDVISGHINYETGELTVSSVGGDIVRVWFVAYASLEENMINPTTRFEIEKINLSAINRRISVEWTIDMEQDAKALFDISVQSEMINVIAEQIALDIDREIINKLIAANATMNPASHTHTFNKIPPLSFTWGQKMWFENVIPVLNDLSAQIYNTCLMGAANTLACNPLDAAIFESLNTFEYTGNSVEGGDVGYRSATVQGGKWKILVSSIVPQGKIIAKYRSNDIVRAAFIYAPYVPALLTPFPLGAIPSLTVMSRYASKVIRNEAIGVLEITNITPIP